jgi:hypothetical protein
VGFVLGQVNFGVRHHSLMIMAGKLFLEVRVILMNFWDKVILVDGGQ